MDIQIKQERTQRKHNLQSALAVMIFSVFLIVIKFFVCILYPKYVSVLRTLLKHVLEVRL